MSFDGNINLYLGRTVRIELKNGDILTGGLDEGDGAILVDETRVDAGQIRDILYCDELDMDTYTIKLEKLLTREGFLLNREELIREVGADFSYGEKIVKFVSHLRYDKDSRRIAICDMQVTHSSHAVKRDILEGTAFLYSMEGGPYFQATLEDDRLLTADGSIPFEPDKITDITLCPEMGTQLTVILNDGQKFSSAVVSVSPKGLVLAEGYNGRIPFDRISQLRYQGKMVNATDSDGLRLHLCGKYRYRHRYLRQPLEYSFRQGQMADFAVGMTRRGLICKDVDLAPFGARREDYGVVFDYTNTVGYGYVDRSYEYGAKSAGMYYLNCSSLGKGWNNNDIDTHKFVYVVKFRHVPNAKFGNRSVTSMEILDQYERSQYRSVHVDDQGNVKAELFETPQDMTGVIKSGYGFLCFFSGDERRSGNAYISHQYSQKGAEFQYFCFLAGFIAKCRGRALDTRENCYLVRYWVDTRQTKPDKLPVAYKVEFLDAYPKGRDYYVNEYGEVSEYNHQEFVPLDAMRNERVVVITKNNNRFLGTLQNNDVDNATVTIVLPDAKEKIFHYSRIAEVWGLGRVNMYNPDLPYGFIQAGGGIYYKNSVIQSEKEPKLEAGELVGFRLERTQTGIQANPVRPLTEVLEEGYVVAEGRNNTYQVIPGDVYGKVQHITTVPEQMRLQNPDMKFKDLMAQDYKVQLHSLYFEGGTPLLRGIERHMCAEKKLYFGYVEKFCDNPAGSGEFSYGYLTPLDAGERQRMTDGIYFHISQNEEFFEQIAEPGENPNKTDPCLVSYQLGQPQWKDSPCAVAMNAHGRFPQSWFDQMMADNQGGAPESTSVRPLSSTGESLQSRIHFLVKQSDVEGAKQLLEEYAQKVSGKDGFYFYYQQMNNICAKEYKLNHTREVRTRWLDCIIKLRKTLDQTAQYGLRLDVLYKQANLTMEEGMVIAALELYREWKQLLEEFCTIYPNKKKGYETFLSRVDRILATEGLSRETLDLDSEENGPSDVDMHAYLEWRLDYAAQRESDSLWAKAHSLRQLHGESEYTEVLKSAVKAELAEVPENWTRSRAHFAFLDLLLDPRCTTEALLPYFANALDEDNTFAPVLGLEGSSFSPDVRVNKCSQFTLDSVILVAVGQMDAWTWLERFENNALLRQRYIRELCCLLRREADHFDVEQMEIVFTEAVEMLRQPVNDKLKISQYAAEVLQKVERFRACDPKLSRSVINVLENLTNYDNLTGFTDRMDCLRSNATRLQAYHKSIQKNPTIHDWNLLWPICARLIGQIQRTWRVLLESFAPSIEMGNLQAVRESNGTWNITVPLRNRKNVQQASNIRIEGYRASPQNCKDLIGDGFDHPFVIRVVPRDPNVEQLTLDLEVRYQYVSDVQFRRDEYTLQRRTEAIHRTVSVSCAADQRQELSMDILNTLGNDAKRTIDTSTPAGRAVAEILKNRSEEIETVISAISTGEKGSRRLMRDGRWVTLYGQWRVGKSVLLHEVNRALQGEEFGDQAITLYVVFSSKQNFEYDTVRKIIREMRTVSDPEIRQLWKLHLKEWEEQNGFVSTIYDLGDMLGRFHEKIAPKTIVLALDEFTNIYYAIKKGNVDVSFLRGFVNFICQTGCIILTAGGEHSVSLMTDYDVNMLQKADCCLEVKYLSWADTKKYVETVISVPSYLGTPEQKERTINRIFELTQGNAFLLHKFCEELVSYVRKRKNLVRIDDITIQATLDVIAKSLNVIGVYFNSLYNPYNETKDEQIEGFGGVRELNLKILESIVEHAFPETHGCRKETLIEVFAEEERFEDFLKVLIDRAVVRDDRGNISVPIDLYYEIQSRVSRKDESSEY